MRVVATSLLIALALSRTALAQVQENHSADDCDAYYRFELQVIEEQRYELNRAAIKAIEAEQPQAEEKERRIAAARADTDKRFEVDIGAAERSKARCLQTAR